jgi:hypothetical protein
MTVSNAVFLQLLSFFGTLHTQTHAHTDFCSSSLIQNFHTQTHTHSVLCSSCSTPWRTARIGMVI